MHLLNAEYFLECFKELKKRKAAGIDGRTVESYSEGEIKKTLEQTVIKIKQKKYHPRPVRRVDILKDNGKIRMLGIPTVVDKVVQMAVTKILRAIYEPNMLDVSYGYRPGKDAHSSLKAINHMIMQEKVNWIIGRFARENQTRRGKRKPETFDFLGFTHYCSTTRDGRFMVKVETSSKKLDRAVMGMKTWLKSVRNSKQLREIWPILKVKLQGHYNYYGISGNIEGIKQYYKQTKRLLFKWTNRRSQKKTWNWEKFERHLFFNPIPQPKLTYEIYHTW